MRLKSDPAYSCLQAGGGEPLLHCRFAAANGGFEPQGPTLDRVGLVLTPMAMRPLYVRRAIRRRGRIVRIYLAKAAIAGDHVGPAGFDRSIFAVPFDVAGADVHDGAPRCIAEISGMTRRHRQTQACCSSGEQKQDPVHGNSTLPFPSL